MSYFFGPLAALHLLSVTTSYNLMFVQRQERDEKTWKSDCLTAHAELSFFSSLLCLERFPFVKTTLTPKRTFPDLARIQNVLVPDSLWCFIHKKRIWYDKTESQITSQIRNPMNPKSKVKLYLRIFFARMDGLSQ